MEKKLDPYDQLREYDKEIEKLINQMKIAVTNQCNNKQTSQQQKINSLKDEGKITFAYYETESIIIKSSKIKYSIDSDIDFESLDTASIKEKNVEEKKIDDQIKKVEDEINIELENEVNKKDKKEKFNYKNYVIIDEKILDFNYLDFRLSFYKYLKDKKLQHYLEFEIESKRIATIRKVNDKIKHIGNMYKYYIYKNNIISNFIDEYDKQKNNKELKDVEIVENITKIINEKFDIFKISLLKLEENEIKNFNKDLIYNLYKLKLSEKDNNETEISKILDITYDELFESIKKEILKKEYSEFKRTKICKFLIQKYKDEGNIVKTKKQQQFNYSNIDFVIDIVSEKDIRFLRSLEEDTFIWKIIKKKKK